MENCKGNTALHIAASLGHFDMTMCLITCAKDQEAVMKDLLLRMKNLEKNTAPHEAIRNDHYDIVELLIREDPELASFTNNFGDVRIMCPQKQYYAFLFDDKFLFSHS